MINAAAAGPSSDQQPDVLVTRSSLRHSPFYQGAISRGRHLKNRYRDESNNSDDSRSQGASGLSRKLQLSSSPQRNMQGKDIDEGQQQR